MSIWVYSNCRSDWDCQNPTKECTARTHTQMKYFIRFHLMIVCNPKILETESRQSQNSRLAKTAGIDLGIASTNRHVCERRQHVSRTLWLSSHHRHHSVTDCLSLPSLSTAPHTHIHIMSQKKNCASVIF